MLKRRCNTLVLAVVTQFMLSGCGSRWVYTQTETGISRNVHGDAAGNSYQPYPGAGITTNEAVFGDEPVYGAPINFAPFPISNMALSVAMGSGLSQPRSFGTGTVGLYRLVLFEFSDNLGSSLNFDTANGTAGTIEGAAETLMGWGRWRNTTVAIDGNSHALAGGTTYQAMHYVFGPPSPALPASGTSHFRLIGWTQPSPSQGLGGTLDLASAELSAQWGGATPKVGMDFRFSYTSTPALAAFTNTSPRFVTTGGLGNPAGSEIAVRAGTSTFGGTIPMVTCILIGDTCEARIDGFFSGPNVERAGVTYQIHNASAHNASGAAVFSNDNPLAPASGGGSGGSGAFTAPLDTSSPPLAMVSAGPSTFTDTTVGISPVTQDSSTGLVTAYTPAETVTINTAQGADMGGDALITWGRWVNGTSRSSGSGGGAYDLDTIGAEQGFHYVIGKPSPSLPASGTANFTLLGATKPTFGDGALPAGTLTSAAMAVEWGGAATRVGVDMTLTMPSDGTYRVMTTGGTTTPGTSEISTTFGDARFQGSSIPVTTTGGARACAGGTCAAKVEGLFTGPNGARAGLVYTVNNGVFFGRPTSIVGAAAFTKQ